MDGKMNKKNNQAIFTNNEALETFKAISQFGVHNKPAGEEKDNLIQAKNKLGRQLGFW